jgi:predicted transcriptional regulator of viral defense system
VYIDVLSGLCLDNLDILCVYGNMSMELRNNIEREEFDYQVLMSALSGYASPRDKVTALLRKGIIIRVKKGLYVFGREYRRNPYCRELLANLIYGPSYVSLEYALSYYGMIPERVEAVTSVTTGRARSYDTPIGRYIYRSTSQFSMGIDRAGSEACSFLIAVPERALADRLRDDRGGSGRTLKSMSEYMFANLRLDEDLVRGLNSDFMEDLAVALRSRKVKICADVIRRLGRRR